MVKMEELKGEELVKKFAEEMEEMLGRKMKSVKVMRAQAESQQARFNGCILGLFYTSCFPRGWQKPQRMLICTMTTTTPWRCAFMPGTYVDILTWPQTINRPSVFAPRLVRLL